MNPKIEAALLDIYSESVKNPPKTLDGHIKNENGITNDYRGRAIYEFFQNAIDRAENKIWIHLNKLQRTLTIANDGEVFSIERGNRNYSDLESLCSINTSSKNQNESIGNKGVGFKSCWEYTKKVTVCSVFENTKWGFELHNPLTIDNIVSPFGMDLIEKWKSNNDYSQVFKNNANQIPSFYFPLPIENANDFFESLNDAKTVIQFQDLTDENIVLLSNKIIEFSEHQIFFVQQLDKLKHSNVKLELLVNDSFRKTLNTQVDFADWSIESKEFSKEELVELQELSSKLNYRIENPKIAIAFPLKQNISLDTTFRSNFYCYLPTEVKCGFNVLMHGDFLLDVSRKQIDFENNPYNKKLLTHLAKLFVETLLNKTELHELPYFGKFLLPLNREEKIEKIFSEELFNSLLISSILKKVYTKDRKWGKDSYMLIFDVIDCWKRNHNSNEKWDSYYNKIYNDTIRHFCDPSIFIVPTFEGDTISYIDYLPRRESSKKLFFRKDDGSIFESNIISELKNVSITNFDPIEREYFDYTKVVRKYNKIEIIRAINNEKINNETDITNFNQRILIFVLNLISDFGNKTEKQFYLTDDKIERQLARIKLPCKNGKWNEAIRCYTEIPSEIKGYLNSDLFFELDIDAFRKLIENDKSDPGEFKLILKKLGVWQASLPIQYENNKLKLPFINFPQLNNNQLKILINNSIPDWQNLVGKEELIKILKSESWFYDEANKSVVAPSKVFLFNDLRPRKCIAQEQKSNELKELYHFLNIQSIDETENIGKIITQLEMMKNLEVGENHKTVYKQLVLRISRLKDANIKEIPLLTTQGKYLEENCWFVPFDHRKYIHHFPNYNFVNFDVNTALSFIDNLSFVKRFEPEFKIKPEMDQLEIDSEIKLFLETNYIPDFFALAEIAISTIDFDKEDCIFRWQNLNIYKANDVWLEVSFNNNIIQLYKDVRKEVLYKPLSKNLRGSIKESVGLLAYDLEDYENDPNLSKFGYAIADSVFRNQNFGDIISNYIQKKQFDLLSASEYLKEKGIGENELNQSKNFIKASVINSKEMESFLNAISFICENVNKENWKEKYNYYDLSFPFLTSKVIENLEMKYENTSKFEALLNLINPYEANLKFFIEHRDYLQICYYAFHNKVLANESFDKLIKSKVIPLEFHNFNFGLSQCYSILGITSELDSFSIDKAKAELNILDLKKNLGLPENLELVPTISTEVKLQSVSSFGKSETHTVKRTYQEREKIIKDQHNRGICMEKILATKYAQELLNHELVPFLNEHIHNIEELKRLKIPDKVDIESLAKLLHVSEALGDGLGYDILEPIIEEGRLKRFNTVEIKSSQNNQSIYLSENERLKILYFAEQKAENWKLYHFVDGKAYDRTEYVYNAIKAHADYYKGDQQLVAENWCISFKN